VVAATGADKKNVGGVRRFVLPLGIGDAGVVEDVTPAEIGGGGEVHVGAPMFVPGWMSGIEVRAFPGKSRERGSKGARERVSRWLLARSR
jgi:hypothetical protein